MIFRRKTVFVFIIRFSQSCVKTPKFLLHFLIGRSQKTLVVIFYINFQNSRLKYFFFILFQYQENIIFSYTFYLKKIMGSTHHHHHYHKDEKREKELLMQIQAANTTSKKYHQQLQVLKKKEKEINDPTKIAIIHRQIFENFLSSLKVKSKNTNQKCLFLVGVIGPTNVGKSSLVNMIAKSKFEVGQGQVTMKNQQISTNKTIIVDTIGLNQERDVTDSTYLNDFYKLDRAIILYESTPKQCKMAFQTLSRILPDEVYLVRTKCDRVQQNERQKLLQREANVIKQWGVNYKHPIFLYSTKQNSCQEPLRKLLMQRY